MGGWRNLRGNLILLANRTWRPVMLSAAEQPRLRAPVDDAGGGTICGRERWPFGLGQRRSAWPKLLCRGESRQRWCQKLNGNGTPDRMKIGSQIARISPLVCDAIRCCDLIETSLVTLPAACFTGFGPVSSPSSAARSADRLSARLGQYPERYDQRNRIRHSVWRLQTASSGAVKFE